EGIGAESGGGPRQTGTGGRRAGDRDPLLSKIDLKLLAGCGPSRARRRVLTTHVSNRPLGRALTVTSSCSANRRPPNHNRTAGGHAGGQLPSRPTSGPRQPAPPGPAPAGPAPT